MSEQAEPLPQVGKILVEVCVASLDAAMASQQAGADRIELNLALELDGLTPSAGLLQRVAKQIDMPIIAMARPRAGGFCYSTDDWETLLADAKWLLANGADGIAFGALNSTGQIDAVRCRQMRELVRTGVLVFHKAFDSVADPAAELNRLIDVGVDRVMTSGLAATALAGSAMIGELIQRSSGRIEILPAGRIGAENVAELVSQTGCRQVHGSFRNSGSGDFVEEIRTVIHRLKHSIIRH